MAPIRLCIVGLLPLAIGCQAGYVIDQGWTQLSLMNRTVPLDSADLDEKVAPDDRAKLRWVPGILRFAVEELGLDPGDSYGSYLDMDGLPVSHVVTAAHPLALIPFEWQFPFVGRVPYKGYFHEEDAEREAQRLRSRELDVQISGAAAFSTLGWFRDPVVSTMLEGDVADLADMLIHEIVHRTIYFPGRSSFNESLATHIALEGTVRFILASDELRPLLPGYLGRRRMLGEREELLLRLQGDLESLYRSASPDETKLRRKAEIFRTAARAGRELWPGTAGIRIPASNAFVLSVTRYHEYRRLLLEAQEARGGNPAELVAYLKALPSDEDPVPALERESRWGGP